MNNTQINRMDDATYEVVAERKRQDKKWGTQNHSPANWLMILMEEVGEFAKADLQYREEGQPGNRIKEELV